MLFFKSSLKLRPVSKFMDQNNTLLEHVLQIQYKNVKEWYYIHVWQTNCVRGHNFFTSGCFFLFLLFDRLSSTLSGILKVFPEKI